MKYESKLTGVLRAEARRLRNDRMRRKLKQEATYLKCDMERKEKDGALSRGTLTQSGRVFKRAKHVCLKLRSRARATDDRMND